MKGTVAATDLIIEAEIQALTQMIASHPDEGTKDAATIVLNAAKNLQTSFRAEKVLGDLEYALGETLLDLADAEPAGSPTEQLYLDQAYSAFTKAFKHQYMQPPGSGHTGHYASAMVIAVQIGGKLAQVIWILGMGGGLG